MQSFGPFAAIRAHHPHAAITLLTTAPFAAWLRAAPWFDHLEVDARPRLWQLAALRRLAAQLRGFDLVYDLQTSSRSTRYFWLAGRPAWSGIGSFRRFPDRNPARNRLHTRERQRSQLLAAGITHIPAPAPAELAWSLAPDPLQIPIRFAALLPGASANHPRKCWPTPHYADLAKILLARGLHVVIAGGPAERPMGRHIAEATGAQDLTGATTLPQLASLLAQASLVIGNDTGPMHLAAALGRPCITLFGNTSNPALTAPRLPDDTQVTTLRSADLANLSVERVAAAVEGAVREG